ncbi:MAG TPA: Rieske 2Fe-2S domain-containing protein, partial [Acidisphaera sp.]|nr:Rieske 2Fe-2S domain-containing protein [Acidisphaera sp.]
METPPNAYAVCRVADIANRRARGFSLLRIDPGADEGSGGVPFHVVIVRWDRRVHGYVNRCPHQASNLDFEAGQFLDPGGTRLMCGKHGALFDVETGSCIDGPC